MARVSAALVFDVLARDRGASKVFRKIGDDAGRTRGRLAAFGGVVASVAKSGALALGALGVAGVSMGVKTAAGLEQARIAFETLLGSGRKADRFLRDLQNFAAKTPFELPGLIDAARQLIGVGQSAESVIPTLRAWGDAAGALGLTQEQFGRVLTAVTQSMAKGKIQAEELMQMTEAGVPIWPLLAKAMGKTVPQLQELSRQGKLAADVVFPALEKQLNKDYGGAMAKQATTLTGLWSTFMDTLNIGLAKAVQPLLPALKSGLAVAIRLVADALSKLPTIVEAVKGALMGFSPSVAASTGLVRQLKGIWDALRNAWVEIQPVLENVGKRIMATVGPALREIVAVIRGQVFPALKAFIPAVTPVVKFLINILGNVLIDTIKAVVSIIKGALKVIAGLFNVFAGLLTGDWKRLWKGLKQIASGLLQAIWGVIRLLILSKIGTVFKIGGRLLTGLWQAAWKRIGSATSSAVKALLGVVKRIPGRIRSGLGNLGKLLYNSGKALIRGLINGIRAMARQAVNVARGVVNDAISAAKSLLGIASPSKVFHEMGVNIGEGLSGGMKESKPQIVKASEGVAAATLPGRGGLPFGKVAASSGSREVKIVVDIRGGDREMRRLIRHWIRTENLLQSA